MALRKAGEDPAIQALGYAALMAGVGAPGIASGIDQFTGPTHGLNSGEIPVNALISLLPLLTMTAGGSAATALSPAADASLKAHLWQVDQKALLQEVNRLAEMERQGKVAPDPQRLQALAGRQTALEERKNALLDQAKNIASRYQEGSADLGREDALRMVGRRGARNLYGGALVGGLAGAIPAILGMQDAQPAGAA